jgi:hypothetical protein
MLHPNGRSFVCDLRWRARCSAFRNDCEQIEHTRSSFDDLRRRRTSPTGLSCIAGDAASGCAPTCIDTYYTVAANGCQEGSQPLDWSIRLW